MIDVDRLNEISYPGFEIYCRELFVPPYTLKRSDSDYLVNGNEVYLEFNIKVKEIMIPFFYHKPHAKLTKPYISFGLGSYHKDLPDVKDCVRIHSELGYPDFSRIWTDTIYKIGDPKDLNNARNVTLHIKFQDFIYEANHIEKGLFKIIGVV
jgi:hypothetical protein